MKKYVFFIRHAKSSWEDLHVADIDRPLNQRGFAAAPEMANFLLGKLETGSNIKFISSPALRAYTTAHFFMDAVLQDRKELIIHKPLYYGDDEDYIDCLHTIDEDINIAMVFGHNPSLEYVSSNLKNGYVGEIPTCCVLQCTLDQPWDKSSYKNIRLESVFKPKDVLS